MEPGEVPGLEFWNTSDNGSNIDLYAFHQAENLAILWVLFVMIFVGNSSVLLALAFNKNRKSRMNYFIMQLAIADLSVGLISVLTDIVWKSTVDWHAGNLGCKVVKYLQCVVTYSSTYVLVALSLDRYDAIRHPMKFSGGWRRAKLMVAVAWLLSAVFSGPTLFLFREEIIKGRKQCWLEFPEPWHWKLYMTLIATSLFFIPTIIITACYAVIVSTIWRKGSTVIVIKKSYKEGSGRRQRDSQQHDSLRKHYGSPRNSVNSVKSHRGSQQHDSQRRHRGSEQYGSQRRHRGSEQHDSQRRHRGSEQYDSQRRHRGSESGTPRRSPRGSPHGSISSRRSGNLRRLPTEKMRLENEHESRRASSRGLIPKAKVKTIKMTFVIVFMFVLCWSPYFVFDLLQVYNVFPEQSQFYASLATLIQSLAPLNSAANPIIYCLFSTRLCRTLRRVPPCSWLGRAASELCPGLVSTSCLNTEHNSTLTSSLQSSRGSRLSSKHVTVL